MRETSLLLVVGDTQSLGGCVYQILLSSGVYTFLDFGLAYAQSIREVTFCRGCLVISRYRRVVVILHLVSWDTLFRRSRPSD